MNLSIFEQAELEEPAAMSVDARSLYRTFEQVKDGRDKRGQRYPLPLLLTLLLLGKLAGETKISGVVDWVKYRGTWLRQQLDWPKRFPTNSTYSYALARCDGEQIAQIVAQVLIRARTIEQDGDEAGRLHCQEAEALPSQVAMDGKTLRGTLRHQTPGQPSVHLLSLYECHSGIVLAQRAVAAKENEISAAAALMHPVLIKGRLISADAMHTQTKWCAAIKAYGGDYLLIAKNNQPTLLEELRDFFADPDAERGEWGYARQPHKGHGRLEVREIWTSTQMNEWFAPQWAGIAQIFRVHRKVTQAGQVREETVYGLTSLTRKQADARRLLESIQAHWHIENRLHYRRDVALGEDQSQVRVAGVPQVLAALNGAVLALMDWLQVPNTAAQMRRFCARPHEALQLLCGPLQR